MRRLASAALVVATAPLFVQAQQSGTAHPAETVEDQPIVQAAPAAKSVPVAAAPVVDGSGAQDSSPAVTLKHHDLAKFEADSDIVEDAPQRAGEIPVGTLVRARLKAGIETATTAEETPFTAELTEPLKNMGRVIVPAGSLLEGRVTEIHGGRRFRGAAMIHLQAHSLVLPDGTRIPLNAAVIDTDQYANTRIDGEGNIVRRDHAKETLAALSLSTGGAAAAGGLIGGVPGALVGAGIGAGVGTVWWLKQDRQASLPAETLLVMSLTSPMAVQSLVREPEFVQTPQTAAPPAAVAVPAPPAKYAESFVPSN